jgi:hypothetical protein
MAYDQPEMFVDDRVGREEVLVVVISAYDFGYC